MENKTVLIAARATEPIRDKFKAKCAADSVTFQDIILSLVAAVNRCGAAKVLQALKEMKRER